MILYGGTICCCNTSVNGENGVFVYYNEDDTSIRRQRLWAESSVFTFLPENARVPGQQGLQQHWGVSLWLIAAQVVLQLSVNLRKLRQSYLLQCKKKKNPCAVLLCYTHMCSVETWLRLWANWDARFSSRQPKRQETSSAILPLYKRLLVVVAGRGEGRGSWFNTEERGEGTVKREKRKTAPEGRDKAQSKGLK